MYSRSGYIQPLICQGAIRGIKSMEQIKSAYLRAEVIYSEILVRYGRGVEDIGGINFGFRTSARRTAATDGPSA